MNSDNPFYHRGAIRQVEHFCGREAEIGQILGLLRNGQSVSLIGPRRIGKSSLLIHLMRPEVRAGFPWGPTQTAAQLLFVHLDCQEFGESPADEVYEALYDGLLDAAKTAGLTGYVADTSGSYRAIDRLLHQMNRMGTAVVVLLDEFELLAANNQLTPYFFARLRGLTTKYGLAYLTASQQPLFNITAEEEILSSPFFNIFVTLPLGLFTMDEARAMLAQRLQESPITFSADLVDYLLFLAGPHPFFLHIAGYYAYRALMETSSLAPVDFAMLDDPIEMEAASHLSYLWQNLSAEEQYTLAITHGAVDTLRQLEQQCLLQNSNGRYSYTSEILHRFVRRQGVPGLIQAGPFIIDLQRHQVWAENQEIALTTSQFAILVCLCQNTGQVVHGDDLEAAVWGEVLVDDPDRLKTLIKRLRRAIVPYDNWIVSERGVGYALRPPES
jgi:hypothetical protein